MSITKMLKVMVVDDNISSRMVTTDGLSALGINNLSIAKDGRDAYNKLVQNPVHLVVSDLYMPDIDGFQLLKAIRAHPKLGNTGFIILTGRKDNYVVVSARQLGVNNVLEKPFSSVKLRSAIESVVGRLN